MTNYIFLSMLCVTQFCVQQCHAMQKTEFELKVNDEVVQQKQRPAKARPATATELHMMNHVSELTCDKFQTYLQMGADIDARDGNRKTALHFAAENGALVAVNILIDAGADINAREINGAVPLALAAWEGHRAIVERLISVGADIEVADCNGVTPIGYATKNRKPHIVQDFIAHGAAVKFRSQQGHTALIGAAKDGNTDIITLLISAGADETIRDLEGRRAIDFAENKRLFIDAVFRGRELQLKYPTRDELAAAMREAYPRLIFKSPVDQPSVDVPASEKKEACCIIQ